ncbi:MAG: MBL fold metallo-hydrolase [Chthoniobacterales bacterium]|nr:MBL fold metallo-hydrolase [Chthoniobacterales bacterium]
MPTLPFFFEDNWCDVIGKASRGLNCSLARLTQLSNLSLKDIEQLFNGVLDKKNLGILAPFLSLHAEALLALAENTPPVPCLLPKQMAQFTTSFHGMQVHSYLLWSEENKTAIAFDTGADLTSLFNKLTANQLTLRTLFLTHGHRDHVEKLSKLLTQTGAEAWIAEADWISGTKPLPKHFSCQLDSCIQIKAHSTPGHSPGGTTYVIQGLPVPVAIVGDAIFARSVGGIPPAAYSKGLQAIEENILSLSPETILCPGHGPLTTVEEERKLNPFFAK